MDNITWLFFDVGSTLIDEHLAYEHRMKEIAESANTTYSCVYKTALMFYKQNKKGDLETSKLFNVELPKWHKEDEKPYEEAEHVLKTLCEKGYNIGIIANQLAGTEQRLEGWGLMKYIKLVLSSTEEGVAKPDSEIFLRALKRADCLPENAVMIGDRLDNDIYPAKKLGFKTVWVKQGFGAYQTPISSEYIPDYSVNFLSELKYIF